MRNNTGSKVRIIFLLASVLVLMLALCGCRTRITNNDEASNVMYDEEGIRQDEYNIRRDELGLGRAPKPVFTGFGAPEDDFEDYDYGSDTELLEDYNPDAANEELYDDTEETEVSSGPQSSGSGTQGGSSGKVVRRRSSSGSSSSKSSSEVEVVLDAGTNGGKINGKESITVMLKKTGKYDSLPSPDVREGYTFSGWFTKKEGGKNVEGRSVASDKKHKLYAQWTENSAEPLKKSYIVSFDANGGSLDAGNTLTVDEGGTYGELPEPTNTGYNFDGWYTAAEDGDKIESGTKFTVNTDQTLYAHWTKDPYKYWEAQLKAKAEPIEKKFKYKSGTDAGEFLQDCGMESTDEDDYDIEIFYGSKDDVTSEGRDVLVIPKEATKSTTKDNVKLIYKLKVLTTLYGGTDLDVTKAAEELEVNETDLEPVEIVPVKSADPE